MPEDRSELLDAVAVVGLACRFPRAPDAERFWQNLAAGVDSVTFFSDEELLKAGVDPAFLADPSYVKAAPILEGIDQFDAGLFGYSPREAELMDPQQRLFLETAWQALEDAAVDPETARERIGVFAGSRLDTYWLGMGGRDFVHSPDALQALIGNDKDYLATQVSYRLDLRGPSLGIQTACSTSLVAVVLACQSLLNWQCDMALAGGVTVRVPQVSGYFHRPGGIASPDGRCRAFSADARGSVFGNGVGVVALKRWEDAVRDGNRVRALIRGGAINNDGARKVGFTAPSEEGQAQVIATAQAVAGVEPETITYVEAHGTGTALGDPIEVAALERVFRARTSKRRFCALGSVKTNVGHLDSAAGIAGLIKATLALENRLIPPSLHFSEPNPAIDFRDSPFYVVTEPTPWHGSGGVRRAGVSSFGIGGTNAHVVLEEAPLPPPPGPAPAWQVFPLSGQTPQALQEVGRNLAAHLRRHSDLAPADVAFTLQVGRRALRYRRAVVARDLPGVAAALEGMDPARPHGARADRSDRAVAFLFPGQGSQYPGMGRGLYREQPTYRAEIDRCAEILSPHLGGRDLRDLIFPREGVDPQEAAERLEATEAAQPALFAVEWALARLWASWGVVPQRLVGHSIGEYVAACLAGVFSLEDGLALVAARGRILQALPPGAMLAVSLPEPDLAGRLPERVSLAAVNGPELCVVSGPEGQVTAFAEQLAAEGVGHRRLHTSHPFHSELVEAAVEPLAEVLRRIRLAPPELPVLSNLTGGRLTPEQAVDPGYWTAHLRGTVRFSDNVRALLDPPAGVLLEVGPGRSLTTLVRRHLPPGDGPACIPCMRHATEEEGDVAFLLGAVGRAWEAGARIDWRALHGEARRYRVALPAYAFQRQRYWMTPGDGSTEAPAGRVGRGAHRELEDWFEVPIWRQSPPRPAAERRARRWLAFVGASDLAGRLVSALRDAGHHVATVAPGRGFSPAGPTGWEIDVRSREDHRQLLEALKREGEGPDAILHALGLDDDGQGPSGLPPDFESLTHLAATLGEFEGGPSEVRILAAGVWPVTGEEAALHPERALAAGLCAALPLEQPGVAWELLDVTPAAAGQEAALVESLVAELESEPAGTLAAFRGARRWERAFEPLRLDPPPDGRPLREDGVYWIVGGWGGIGLELARDWARRGRIRLVLTGRSPVPPRPEWESRLAALPDGASEARRLRALLEIEGLGAEVLALSADVTDTADLRRVVGAALDRFGGLHGVVHAAGVAGGGLLHLRRPEEVAAVLAPKVRGSFALDDALRGLDLDFLALFSSTIGLTGAFGQADYAAANAFLDAFAQARAAREGRRTVAVAWDGWSDVGMTARRDREDGGHPWLGRRVRIDEGEAFAARLDPRRDWVLAEHRIFGLPVLPGAAYVEIAQALAARHSGGRAVEIRDLSFLAPRVAEGPIELRSCLVRDGDGARFRVFGRPVDAAGASWVEHAAGRVAWLEDGAGLPAGPALPADGSFPDSGVGEAEDGERARAMSLGPRWESVRRVDVNDGEVWVRLELPDGCASDLESFGLHPALFDRATSFGIRFLADGYHLPWSYRRIVIRGRLPRIVWSQIRRREPEAGTFLCDVRLFDEEGLERVAVEGFALRRIEDAEALKRSLHQPGAPAVGAESLLEEVLGDGAPGPRAIDPERGVEALRRILAWQTGPQVAVSPRGLAEAWESARAFGESARRKAAEPARAAGVHPRPDLQVAYVEPRNDVERALVGIWQRMLGLERVGVEDDFFELGGHSLLAIRLASEVREALGVEIPPRDLFEVPSVAALASRVADARQGAAAPAPPPIVAGPRDGDLPMSFAQERQWFLAQMDPDSPLYNHATGIHLDGRLEVPALARSLEEVVRRHDSFRSTFPKVNGRPVLRVAAPGPRGLPVVDLRALPPARAGQESASLAAEEARRPFDLLRGPLLRSFLLRRAPEDHVLLFTLHHIAGDHWSAGILIRELAALYSASSQGRPSPLPELEIQYADFARWQRAWMSGEALEEELAYWRRRLGGRLPFLELPTDRPRQATRSIRGASEPFALSRELDLAVRRLAKAEGVTVFMLLLAALKVALHRRTGQTDLIVGCPVAGRNRAELEGIIGYFVNALALRTDLSGDPTFRELLQRVREATLGAYAHQELPFEKLVEELRPERRPGYSPVFQVVFNFQNAPIPAAELPELTLQPLPPARETAKYDFTLYMGEAGGSLSGSFEYRTDLFDAGTVVRLREDLVAVLEQAVAAPGLRLGSLTALLETREMEMRMTRQEEVQSSNLKKLKITKRRAVSVVQEDLVRKEYLAPDSTFPLVILPNMPDVDLVSWAERNVEEIERELLVHGAILFRGFSVPSPAVFEGFVNRIEPELLNYVEGSSPRIMVGDKVYTSTEYPPEYFVSMHNELSYAHKWPSKIFFYCQMAPQDGGETPIADSRKVWELLEPEVRRKFQEKGVIYTRNLHGDRGAGLAWQTVFETSDRSTVEAYCNEGDIEFRWKDDGGLATRQVRPGSVRHPKTGERVWFNQADQWHPSNLGEDLAAALLATTREEDLPINASFGDGTPLDPAELDHVREVFRRAMVAFPWRQGDVLMLDNTLAAHGRMPFSGPRRVLVAMGGIVRLSELPE